MDNNQTPTNPANPANTTTPNPALDRLQKRNQRIQELLMKEQIVIEKNNVKLIMRGDQRVLELTINGVAQPDAIEAINEANGKTQLLAADRFVQASLEEKNPVE